MRRGVAPQALGSEATPPSSALRAPPGRGPGAGSSPAREERANAGRASPFDLLGRATIRAADSARGVATSGWRGRSFSLGIADSVTVIAKTAALADAAATLIANAVDLPNHPGVVRVAARDLAPESDLGERLVAVAVGRLSALDVEAALDAGAREAETFPAEGLIEAASLALQGGARLVGGAASLYKLFDARRTGVENAFG